jgi:hypothetical protein
VSETTGGVTTTYLVDTLNPTGYSQVLCELVNGSVTKTYTYGRQRISENQLSGSTWTPSFYAYDGHGNVRFLTISAGTVGNTYQFDASGVPIASIGTTVNSYLYRRSGCFGDHAGVVASRKLPSFAVARNCGIGSSCLNADVNAFDRLHMVRGWNSSCCGLK